MEKQSESKQRTIFQTCQFGLVIVYNPFKESKDFGKWLAVKESRNRGWWIPGGAVDFGESFQQAALRECREEAGIDVELKGVLRVDHSVKNDNARMRVIFYAEPTTLEMCGQVKTVPDAESEEARWVTVQDLHSLG